MNITLKNVLDSQKDLDALCADRPQDTREPFTPNAFYGMADLYRAYAGLPASATFPAVIPHGITTGDHVWDAELTADLPAILGFSPVRRNAYHAAMHRLQVRKLILPAASPWVYLCDTAGDLPRPERRGTLFFPHHSSHRITMTTDFHELAGRLARLGPEFQPVRVCIYWKDHLLGHHRPFEQHGLEIVSAGHMFDPAFPWRLYHLFSMHRHFASNSFGSHVYYGIHSGCSFFHIDHQAHPTGTRAATESDVAGTPPDRARSLRELFSTPVPEPTALQRELVDAALGCAHRKSPQELRAELNALQTASNAGTPLPACAADAGSHRRFHRNPSRTVWFLDHGPDVDAATRADAHHAAFELADRGYGVTFVQPDCAAFGHWEHRRIHANIANLWLPPATAGSAVLLMDAIDSKPDILVPLIPATADPDPIQTWTRGNGIRTCRLPQHAGETLDKNVRPTAQSACAADRIERALFPEGDYVSPGFRIIHPDNCFPHLTIGDRHATPWPWLRREIPHNWYVDRRQPVVGFLSRDEVHVLYNNALQFAGEAALEIGCWFGWSAGHLAMAGVRLDVIDPVFEHEENLDSTVASLQAAGVLGSVTLIQGRSPDTVADLARQTGRRWPFIFIDGNHDAPGPLNDAVICERLAADNAMILFHDLASPDVAEGFNHLKQRGWNTLVYQTMQIMGVAWRGNVHPVLHQPDPDVNWTLPDHLAGHPVSEGVAGAPVAAGRVPTLAALLQNGIDALNSNRIRNALTLFESALRQQPDQFGILFGLAVCQARLGDTAPAIATLQRLLTRTPGHRKAGRLLRELTRQHRRTDGRGTAPDPCGAAIRPPGALLRTASNTAIRNPGAPGHKP